MICVDLKKDKLTSIEARSNLNELHKTITKEHILEVLHLIWKKEDDEYAEECNFINYDIYGDTD